MPTIKTDLGPIKDNKMYLLTIVNSSICKFWKQKKKEN